MIKKKKKFSIISVVSIFALVFSSFAFLYAINEMEKTGIIAMVDPAIYKPDDTTLTIYGSCLDSDSHPASGSSAKITIYDSTQDKWVDNVAMTEIFTGRFNYSTTAPSAAGNYFIEMNCSDSSAWALAYSNFQVAGWAGNIGDIKAKTDNLPSDPADQSILYARIDNAYSACYTICKDTGTTPYTSPTCAGGWSTIVNNYDVNNDYRCDVCCLAR